METTMTTQISKLRELGLKELREEYEKVFGKPSKSRNAKQLFAQIARKMQGDAVGEGGTAKPTLTVTAKFDRKKKPRSKRVAKPKETKGEPKRAQHRTAGQRDPRLPKVGTTITREYKGKQLLVRVLDEGFEYEGKPYRSLSALAQAITGAKAINGFLFFQLGKYAKKEKAGK